MGQLNHNSLQAIVFDFDGVLTDDRVWVDQDGRETVCCSRRDGLGFDLLRATGIQLFILSTETNLVVAQRAKKLKISCIQGSNDKALAVQALARDNGFSLSEVLYVGNDINDLEAMKLCGYSACPSDAHAEVKKITTFHLQTSGGNGVVREIVESLLGLDPAQAWNHLHSK
jgi:N-acylneuraminate cytidylyltransferase